MAQFTFVYLNLDGEGVTAEVDLDSINPDLNPFIKRDMLVADLAEHRAALADDKVGSTVKELFAFGAQGDLLRDELTEVSVLCDQLDLAREQQINATADAIIAATEDEQAQVKARKSDVVYCDGITTKGKPCKNTAKVGDTKCGPHRDKANKEASMTQQLPLGDYIVAGTGSREIQSAASEVKTNLLNKIEAHLTKLKEIHGDRLVVMSGMAEGFDKALAVTAVRMGIRLWCAVPNKGYGSYYWAQHSLTGFNMMNQFNQLIDAAEKVVYVMEDIHGIPRGLYLNGKHSNFVRNDYMVDTAEEFLVLDPSTPGTRQCFIEIRKARKPYTIIEL